MSLSTLELSRLLDELRAALLARDVSAARLVLFGDLEAPAPGVPVRTEVAYALIRGIDNQRACNLQDRLSFAAYCYENDLPGLLLETARAVQPQALAEPPAGLDPAARSAHQKAAWFRLLTHRYMLQALPTSERTAKWTNLASLVAEHVREKVAPASHHQFIAIVLEFDPHNAVVRNAASETVEPDWLAGGRALLREQWMRDAIAATPTSTAAESTPSTAPRHRGV